MKIFTLKRLAVYLATFVIILLTLILATSFWKSWDYSLYKTVYIDKESVAEKLSQNIAIVNIERPDLDSKSASLAEFRKRIISFLNTVGEYENTKNEDPEAIILDVAFSSDTIKLKELEVALKELKDRRIKVYAVYSLKEYFNNIPIFEANDAQQAQVLYDSILEGGRLHSGFEIVDGLISYPSDIFLKGAFKDSIQIESIIKRVALDDGNTKFTKEFQNLTTPFGPIEAMQERTYQFQNSESDSSLGTFEPSLNTDDKFVFVGDLTHDFETNMATPRTYFLAWALNEEIVTDRIAKQPITNLSIIIGQTLFFSLFTVLIFALLFKYLKRLQTKPKILALLAFSITLLFLIVYGLLVYAFGKVIPIGLTIMAMALVAILSWRFAHKFLVTGVAEGSEKYDVFISYSHGNSDWVKKNVFEPLNEFRKPNGDKLSIFFDVKSIGIGEPFTAKYMWGIVDSKVFIPVMSEEYYGKNHCKNEMDLAYKRFVEELIDIKPIVFSFECVPDIYTHMNFLDINVIPDFINKIKEDLSNK
ncbi:toll/interleukin-1 receptor domain-containing protein [Winogradskyella alexanderae]|uniref:Toll/interleukin-1 receptor domain-containing protein n=1 Tax=Winogradskyella alexanderae TaxID=2877123 RepID=A0ABS7XTH3_9FLAO|nr:toll/interleukin-1 receptor domain-containing protein [Winogradskyella alexanderae]MCA0132131.1 toll/interleukin-1 receptor domain-containing protein [Winogradskyella alexanderae]